MESRVEHNPKEDIERKTEDLRDAFLTGNRMQDDTVQLFYTHYARVIMGGVKPVKKIVPLATDPELKADYFLQRRHVGIINVGGKGIVQEAASTHELDKQDCLYLGKGVKNIDFASADPHEPAFFYLLSAPAHA